MSAALLWCVFVLGTRISAAIFTRNGSDITPMIENQTQDRNGNGYLVHNPSRRIVVEEVDKHGNSVVKELELPDYEGSEERKQERKRVAPQGGEGERGDGSRREDLYGCNSRRESQRKKCLQRQKKFIKGRYKNWKALFRRIIKDLDGRIRMIGHDGRKEAAKGNFTFMAGFSPKNMMRKKE